MALYPLHLVLQNLLVVNLVFFDLCMNDVHRGVSGAVDKPQHRHIRMLEDVSVTTSSLLWHLLFISTALVGFDWRMQQHIRISEDVPVTTTLHLWHFPFVALLVYIIVFWTSFTWFRQIFSGLQYATNEWQKMSQHLLHLPHWKMSILLQNRTLSHLLPYLALYQFWN